MPRLPSPTSLANTRALLRWLFIVVIPLVLMLSMCQRELRVTGDIGALSFPVPPGWHYVSPTPVRPTDGRVRFSARELEAAIEGGQAAPLFVVTRYPHPHQGLNPTIGINLGYESKPIPTAASLLERNVAEVQQRSGNALVLLEPMRASAVAGVPAASIALGSQAPATGMPPDRLQVTVVVLERLSMVVAASGAYAGEDAVEDAARAFLAGVRAEPR